ncbi:MAG: MTAP family purine nucleoside phosphorylase [Fimbriimonadaceae bacterium]
MIKVKFAMIGGTGVGSRLAELPGAPLHVPTERGIVRGRLCGETFVLQRHSVGHKTPPHKVAYEGFAFACAELGVEACFSTAAVGSMRPDWPAGTLAVPHDFVDLTFRQTTLFDWKVIHTDFSSPFPARDRLLVAAAQLNLPVQPSGIYVCGNGPRYETPHEIDLYGKIGDLVGMTAASEAIAMREAGVPYACLCVVTNLACGLSENPLSHEEVVDEMNRSGEKAVAILLGAAK